MAGRLRTWLASETAIGAERMLTQRTGLEGLCIDTQRYGSLVHSTTCGSRLSSTKSPAEVWATTTRWPSPVSIVAVARSTDSRGQPCLISSRRLASANLLQSAYPLVE